MNVTILDDYQDAVRTLDCFKKLAAHKVTVWNDHTKDVEVLAKRLKDTEALVLIRERTPIRAPLIERLSSLKIISQRSVYPHIDLEACTKKGIVLSSDMHPGRPSFATGELTFGLILSAMRHIPKEVAALKAGRWQSTMGVAVRGRTLGIYGYGRIGAQVATYARAFGMKVIVWGREGSFTRAKEDGFTPARSREAFFSDADVVSIHVRLTKETRGSVTAKDLALMKASSLLVNTSRAEVIETDALVAALKLGHPGSAAVDVYENEPVLNGNHPLLKLDNALCTPHIGYVERDGYETAFSSVFDQINAFGEGKLINVINPEVLQDGKA
jgi:D-3-phosphoglycerate dehydrogenase